MDIEKAMQFIVEHEAKIAAKVDALTDSVQAQKERVDGHEERLTRIETSVATVTDLVGRLAQAEIRLVERMQGQETRLASLETSFTKLMERLERFIQGREGNGRKRR